MRRFLYSDMADCLLFVLIGLGRHEQPWSGMRTFNDALSVSLFKDIPVC